jgi:hypothetical protein
MRNLNEYDFSKGSGLKDSLLKKCLSQLAAGPAAPAGRIGDDELAYVAAAGADRDETACPWPPRPCESCAYALPGPAGGCALGRRKRKEEPDV